MRYENAYGGFDDTVPLPKVTHLEQMLSLDPGVYPRNPIGRGYVVSESARLDGLVLPNIENPADLLTPQRLVTVDPLHWWRQPMPWSCNWFSKGWYPRLVHYGAIPDGLPADDRLVPEVRCGYLDVGHVRKVMSAKLDTPLDWRCADAASPALILPKLDRIDPIELTSLSPDGSMVVQVPPDQPRVLVRHLGKVSEPRVTTHRILISLLEMGVYAIWHASWVLPQGLLDSLKRSEDPLKTVSESVEVFVDRERLQPLDAEPVA